MVGYHYLECQFKFSKLDIIDDKWRSVAKEEDMFPETTGKNLADIYSIFKNSCRIAFIWDGLSHLLYFITQKLPEMWYRS